MGNICIRYRHDPEVVLNKLRDLGVQVQAFRIERRVQPTVDVSIVVTVDVRQYDLAMYALVSM